MTYNIPHILHNMCITLPDFVIVVTIANECSVSCSLWMLINSGGMVNYGINPVVHL